MAPQASVKARDAAGHTYTFVTLSGDLNLPDPNDQARLPFPSCAQSSQFG